MSVLTLRSDSESEHRSLESSSAKGLFGDKLSVREDVEDAIGDADTPSISELADADGAKADCLKRLAGNLEFEDGADRFMLCCSICGVSQA